MRKNHNFERSNIIHECKAESLKRENGSAIIAQRIHEHDTILPKKRS